MRRQLLYSCIPNLFVDSDICYLLSSNIQIPLDNNIYLLNCNSLEYLDI